MKLSAEYYTKRFDLIMIPLALVNGYYALFLIAVYNFHIVKDMRFGWLWPIGTQIFFSSTKIITMHNPQKAISKFEWKAHPLPPNVNGIAV